MDTQTDKAREKHSQKSSSPKVFVLRKNIFKGEKDADSLEIPNKFFLVSVLPPSCCYFHALSFLFPSQSLCFSNEHSLHMPLSVSLSFSYLLLASFSFTVFVSYSLPYESKLYLFKCRSVINASIKQFMHFVCGFYSGSTCQYLNIYFNSFFKLYFLV